MEIHNLVEDYVIKTVNDIFDAEEESLTRSYCTCKQCRLDVSCFVLNRLEPLYVLSSRGIAFSETDYGKKLQRLADVVSLIKTGIDRVSTTPRPNHNKNYAALNLPPDGPVFNFRPVVGRLFNGVTFAPIDNADISMFSGDKLVPMMDSNWANPCFLGQNTNGIFTFWPAPVVSKLVGERCTFEFTIEACIDGFEPLTHYFEMDLISDTTPNSQFSMQAAHRLQDLYVFEK